MRWTLAAALLVLLSPGVRADRGAVERAVAPLELPPAPKRLKPGRTAPEASGSPEIKIPPEEALRIGRRLWQNEAGGKVSALTDWNQGEAFASLGIGHFIWYPAGYHGPFIESFPPLLDYLAAHGVSLPDWLRGRPVCPWSDRDSFYKDFDSAKMVQLRDLLRDTVAVQAGFAAQRMEESLPKILAAAPAAERQELQSQFFRLAKTPGGFYPLVDYVNFKGEGTALTERYQGKGWGLLQVLEGMSGEGPGQAALDSLADSARAVLQRRVRLSPPERHESRWLSGWLRRVETYRAPLAQ